MAAFAMFGVFSLVTAAYLVFAYAMPKPPSPAVYVGVVLLCEAIVGLSSVRSACASLDPTVLSFGLLQMLLPWAAVFGVTVWILNSATLGSLWRAPFGNGIVYPVLAVATNIKALLKEVVPASFPSDDYTAATQLNTTTFAETMASWNVAPGPTRTALLKLIAQRDVWADAIWYALSGFLASSIASSSLAGIKCTPTAAQMHAAYEAAVSRVHSDAQAQKDAKVYTLTN